MEKYTLRNDLKVFAIRVENFPQGIGEAFNALTAMLPPGDHRSMYGISECRSDGIVYRAAALETFEGEAEQYGCESYTIPGGDYLTEKLKDWPHKTASIRDIFAGMHDERFDTNAPLVEWYKDMDEMLCMVRLRNESVSL